MMPVCMFTYLSMCVLACAHVGVHACAHIDTLYTYPLCCDNVCQLINIINYADYYWSNYNFL